MEILEYDIRIPLRLILDWDLFWIETLFGLTQQKVDNFVLPQDN